MQKDEISQPVKKGEQFYILKVTDRRLPTLEESREQLLKEARAQKGYSKGVEIVKEAEQKFKQSGNIETTVAELNQKYKAQVAEVKETPFFSEGDSIAELGAAVGFQDAVFELQNTGDIGEYLNVNNGFAVPQYIDRRDPHDPSFEEVKARVEDRYRTDKSREMIAQIARQLADSANADALKAAAQAQKIKFDERNVSGNDTIGSISSEAQRERIYQLKVSEVLRDPISIDDGSTMVVASLKGRKDADMGDPFQKQRRQIEEGLLSTKRNAMFTAYLAWAQKQLREQGKIKVYQDVIQSSIADAPEGEGPSGGPAAPVRSRPTRRAPPR
jgi:peptidyl-prolyl cis-trans isomerase D